MIKQKNFSLIWVFSLVFLYALIDALNSASAGNENTNRSLVHLVLILIVLSIAFFILLKRYIYMNNLLLAMLCFTLYYAFDFWFIKQSFSWGSIVYIGLSLWWIVTIVFIRNTILTTPENLQTIIKFARIMFIFYFIVIIYGSFNIAKNSALEHGHVGYIYHTMAILPILFLEQNKTLKNIYLVATIFLAIFSLKRGAIIIFPVMVVVYFLVENKVGVGKHNIGKMVAVLIAVAATYFIIDTYTGGELSSRFTAEELADGSGRADIYSTIISNVSSRDGFALLFGIARYGEIKLGVGAHNEWLGRLEQLGVIGLVLFAVVFWQMVKPLFKLIRQKSLLAPSYALMVVFITLISMVSGLYFVHSTFYIMVYIALISVLSNVDKSEQEKLLTHLNKGKKSSQ